MDADQDKRPVIYQQCSSRSSPLPDVIQSVIEQNFKVVWKEELDTYRDKICCIIVSLRAKADRQLLESFPNLKVVVIIAVGYTNIDVKACKALGIRVGYTPNVLTDTTADMAVALLLSAARRVVEGDKMCRDPNFTVMLTGWFGYQVSGTTAGIVGMGRIGLQIAKRLQAFNMKILYYNRNPRTDIEGQGVNATYVPDLYSMLSECDYVVLAAPATPTTYHMFNEKEFKCMKSTSVFINIARGSLVNQDALVKVLQSNTIGAAGLDVTDPEPLPRDHPLLRLPNVTLTPHSGTATLTTRLRMVELTVANIWAGLEGRDMPAEVI